ncbi:hypothetical protein GCM10009757_25290 [Streptomyces cheonanensis]|uniref:Uncharacterized protein n=1 Tax=Streptomyces cheonanensis TaxID=312720 RepID=A0ABN2V4Y0_9ACTN
MDHLWVTWPLLWIKGVRLGKPEVNRRLPRALSTGCGRSISTFPQRSDLRRQRIPRWPVDTDVGDAPFPQGVDARTPSFLWMTGPRRPVIEQRPRDVPGALWKPKVP